MTQLSHVDEHGRVRMVDTGNKEITSRRAVASARVLMTSETVSALREHRTPKGDPLEAARLAGIMAAKRTSDLIPLCHPLPLTHIDVQATVEDDGVALRGGSLDKRANRRGNGGADGSLSRGADGLRHVQSAGKRNDDHRRAAGAVKPAANPGITTGVTKHRLHVICESVMLGNLR